MFIRIYSPQLKCQWVKMKIINDEYQKAQNQAGMWGVVPLRTVGGHPGSRRPESAGGPRDALASIVSHCTTQREGHLETQLFLRCSGARLQWPYFALCSTDLVPKGQPALDPLPSQAPASMGAALPAHWAFLTILTPSCRLSPVSHGNTIALFFRSLLPNYTVEVRGVSPRGASLRPGVGSGGLAQTGLISTGGATGGWGARGSAP